MTPEERIEAVALAIAGQDRELEDVARAAILATLQSLLEPSEAMMDEGRLSVETFVEPEYAARDAWVSMVTAAIKEHQ